MIDLRHLRHALALAEHRSFARAAIACHITQSALTRSIQSLEESLGVVLFERNLSGVESTDLGKLVLRHALSLDTTSRELERELRLAQGLEVGELTIGVGLYGGLSLITPVVALLNRLQPTLKVRIHVVPWNALPIRARAREADVIVAELGSIQDQKDFDTIALSEHQASVICRPAHPLTAAGPWSNQDLFRFPIVGPFLTDDVLERLCAKDPIAYKSVIHARDAQVTQCDSAALIKDLVMDSDALTIMYPFMIDRELKSGHLAMLPHLPIGITARFAVAKLAGRTVSAATATFIELLQAHDLALSQKGLGGA